MLTANYIAYVDPVERFSMMTTAANPIVDKIHSRMPLILLSDECEEWLYWELLEDDRPQKG